MSLQVPTSDFGNKFALYREAYAEEISVFLGTDGNDLFEFLELMSNSSVPARDRKEELLPVLEEYIVPDHTQLADWLSKVGVLSTFVDHLVDLAWNWRLLQYDLGEQRVWVSKVQKYPLEPESVIPFRVPRPETSRDIFDPMQDRRIQDFRSLT